MAVKAANKITLIRVDDGAKGPQGPQGPAGADGQMLYATCGTASATVAKVATLASGTLTLKAGVSVAVKFTYANNVASPTLNIGGTGGKAIYTQGVRYAYWAAGATVLFTYDGSYWRVASEPVYASVVTIGNPSGRNIYIEGQNIAIRNGNTVLAKFSATSIDLGENSDQSQISFCGNTMYMGVFASDDVKQSYYKATDISVGSKSPAESGYSSSPRVRVNKDDIHVYGANGIDRLRWTLLKEVSGTAFGAEDLENDISLYNVFLLTIGPFYGAGDGHNSRILASSVIPGSILTDLIGHDDANGAIQARYSDQYWAGMNVTNNRRIAIRASGADAIARLWAR